MKMTTKTHTAGPWEACERGDYRDDGIVILGDDMRVAVVNRDEDAPLIAAAPELLAELVMQVRNCPVCRGDGVAVDVLDLLTKEPLHQKTPCNRCTSARAAISKATAPQTKAGE